MIEFRTHGKWIFVGEHTVLRGGEGLVFPVKSRYLDFQFIQGETDLVLNLESNQTGMEMAFWGVYEKALQKLNVHRGSIKGTLNMKSNIPVGAGMGASASLCVTLAKFFIELGYLAKDEAYNFAKELEDLFHGESSGLDVAVTLKNHPLRFKKPNQMINFKPTWQPHFYLSYCGKKGVTADCIKRVQKLIKEDPVKGELLDERMKQAVAIAIDGLVQKDNLSLISESIDLARSCFTEWGLVSKELEDHMNLLREYGALSVKPTGSGDGGFVLSLWEQPPMLEKINIKLIQA